MEGGKRPVFTNNFGSIFSDRVSFNVKTSLFGDTKVNDLPIRDITSVQHKTSRNIVVGILGSITTMLILIALVFELLSVQSITMLYVYIAALLVVSLVQFASLMALVGWAEVTIKTGTGRSQSSVGKPGLEWAGHHHAAHHFVTAVRKAMPERG